MANKEKWIIPAKYYFIDLNGRKHDFTEDIAAKKAYIIEETGAVMNEEGYIIGIRVEKESIIKRVIRIFREELLDIVNTALDIIVAKRHLGGSEKNGLYELELRDEDRRSE